MTESTETNGSLLVAEMFEEVAQNFEGLDPNALALRGQELADHPVTSQSYTGYMSGKDSQHLRGCLKVKQATRLEKLCLTETFHFKKSAAKNTTHITV